MAKNKNFIKNSKADRAYARKAQEKQQSILEKQKAEAKLRANAKMQVVEINRLIAFAKANKSKSIDLSSNKYYRLREIPAEVYTLEDLEELNLFNNDIAFIPNDILKLKKLKLINVSWNPIERMPDLPGITMDWQSYLVLQRKVNSKNIVGLWLDNYDKGYFEKKSNEIFFVDILSNRINELYYHPTVNDIKSFSNLKLLYITNKYKSYNFRTSNEINPQIHNLINNLNQITNLQELGIFGIAISEIPESFSALENLAELSITGCGINNIPDWLPNLNQLELLNLRDNELSHLPEQFSNLINLKQLYLANNSFNSIPDELFNIPSLEVLELSQNNTNNKSKIKVIPKDILKLNNLKLFIIEGQPIESLPLQVVNEGIESIRNYWRQDEEVGIDYLCEAKMLIIGEAGAGKTTLIKKINDPNYVLLPQEDSTEGIDVIRWSFPSSIKIKKEGPTEFHQTDFNVSIWDFGGQEIYHATHQFFLTKRSLYILVSDDRKEDTDFNYWLQIVDLLSDGSPLLIVQNEKQDRQRTINIGQFRSNFPNLVNAFRINLANNRGLIELVASIQRELERLPHIGEPLLKTWKQVRLALEKDSRDYITLEEYLAICQDNGFVRREDKLQLARYLNDLGICLHFQDDPVLKNIVILKPKWGTDAVYKVLDEPDIFNKQGRFSSEDIKRVWASEKYTLMHDELLHLMIKFKLCYKLQHGDNYIAPQLLSPDKPDYNWESKHEVCIRYEYEFMPKGILTRFIVGLNNLIADPNLVWKYGVLLKRDTTSAEVIEDYNRRKLYVRVNGLDKRGLTAIIDEQIDLINKDFSRLKCTKYLPCNCELCKTVEEPYAYSLEELKDFAMQGDEIQCRNSRKLVNANVILNEFFPISAPGVDNINHYHLATTNMEDTADNIKEVYVSYAWDDESKIIVDQLEEFLNSNQIRLLRDVNELEYKDSIQDFMSKIGKGKAVVIIISKKYLESDNCMYEIVETMKSGDFLNRIFPIILGDSKIYDPLTRIKYVKFWEDRKNELDGLMKEVSGEYLDGFRDSLDQYSKNRELISNITKVLSDTNALSAKEHLSTNFEALFNSIKRSLE